MLIVCDEQIMALKNRMADAGQRQNCLEEIQRMLEIKQTLLWRADAGQACCGWPTVMRFTTEVQFLEDVLEAYQEQQVEKAVVQLEDYRVYLSKQL